MNEVLPQMAHGMAQPRPPLVGYRPPKKRAPRMLEVLQTIELSPSLRRIVLGGPELVDLVQCSAAAHIKLFFPRGGQAQPVLPQVDSAGRVQWPPVDVRPVVRTYSVRDHDSEQGRLTVDFVLHEPAGPASLWAQRARVGMRVGFAGPGGPVPMLPDAMRYLLAGDLSALPAIGALTEQMPASAQGRVLVELDDLNDAQPLSAPAGVEVCYLTRGRNAGSGGELLSVVRQAPPDAANHFAWVAGESAQVVAVRDYLLHACKFSKRQLYAVPYWKRNEDEEAYHDERHRIMDELAASGS